MLINPGHTSASNFIFNMFLICSPVISQFLPIVSRLGKISWLIVIIVTNISKLAEEGFDWKDENILIEHNLLVIIHFILIFLPAHICFIPFSYVERRELEHHIPAVPHRLKVFNSLSSSECWWQTVRNSR